MYLSSSNEPLFKQTFLPIGDMPKISIIIPIYNAEKYLDECLSSVLQQTYKDFEVIMVDDGSKDGSASICQAFAMSDPRFVYIHKENGGVSSARNKGLDVARGEFISFVDSDDWISENYVETFLRYGTEADITFFGLTAIKVDGSIREACPKDFKCSTRKEAERMMHELRAGGLGNIFGWTCNKFFRSSIIASKEIRFDEQITFFEDELFTFDFCKHINSLHVVNKQLYFYRMLPTGLTAKGMSKEMYKILVEKQTERLRFFNDGLLKEHMIKTMTDLLAKDIYASPVSSIYNLLKDYQEFVKKYPQPGILYKKNHLTQYLTISFWLGYLYCMIRKI